MTEQEPQPTSDAEKLKAIREMSDADQDDSGNRHDWAWQLKRILDTPSSEAKGGVVTVKRIHDAPDGRELYMLIGDVLAWARSQLGETQVLYLSSKKFDITLRECEERKALMSLRLLPEEEEENDSPPTTTNRPVDLPFPGIGPSPIR